MWIVQQYLDDEWLRADRNTLRPNDTFDSFSDAMFRKIQLEEAMPQYAFRVLDIDCKHTNVTRKMYETWCNNCGQVIENCSPLKFNVVEKDGQYHVV